MRIRKKSSLFFYVTIFVLMALCSFQLNAQEDNNTSKILKKIVIQDANCNIIEPYLKITNKELGLTEFCAEKDEFYNDKRMVAGESKIVKVHRPTNMIVTLDEREDGYITVITYLAFYDLNSDGVDEIFFAHGSTYATILRLDILQKENDTYKIIARGLIEAKADSYILPTKTNGYYDILQKSDVWKQEWLYQFIDTEYKLIKHTK